MGEILLSICIPTNGRIDILKKTLNSIYLSVSDYSDFEVVISDNSNNNELEEILKCEYGHIPNITYEKSHSIGFLNSINSLKIGRGKLLKLHNNYTKLGVGALNKMITLVKENKLKKPVLFFSDGSLKGVNVKECESFDLFVYHLSFYSSWSTGFSVWKSDLEKESISYNSMFPHTSILFGYEKGKQYVICNEKIFENQNVPNKGGYNLFHVFAVDYLDMLSVCLQENRISVLTFNHVKFDLYFNFLIKWYCNTKVCKNEYTFDLSKIRESIQKYYSSIYYYLLVFMAYLYAIRIVLGKIKNKILR